jgi:hypothetical protein
VRSQVASNRTRLSGKKGGKVTVTGRVVHSTDGKIRTATASVTDAKGRKIKSTSVYDRQ